MTLVSGMKRVAEVGTAVRLSDASQPANRLHLEAIPANTDLIYIGGPTTHGGQPAGMSIMGDATNKKPSGVALDNVNLQDVWIDALVANEGVSWMAEID